MESTGTGPSHRLAKPPVPRVRGVVISTVVMVLVMVGAASAQAATTGSLTMVSQGGDYVGGGADFVFDSPGTIGLSGGLGEVEVSSPTPSGAAFGYTLDFAPPSGQQLADGEYNNILRYPFEGPTAPGLDIYGDGRGCNMDYGRFVIKDIAVDSSGHVDRFWALFEQHCEGPNAPALFGEVRLNEPPNGSAAMVAPAAIDWPDTPIGTTGTYVPVTVVAGSRGTTISSVKLAGPDARDFVMGADACTGAKLPAGGNCQVHVAVAPTVFADLEATLVITNALGSVTDVPLALLAQPFVSGTSPVAGSPAGGTAVTIHGSEFTGVTGVTFGSQPATSYTVDSPTQITAISPGGSLDSSVDVTVSNGHGTSGVYAGDTFVFANPPDAPTAASATAGAGEATVSFAGSSNDGGSPITQYTVTASPGGARATGAGSPIVVTGLSAGTKYTFDVTATNAVGTSPPSVSNAVTTLRPTAITILTSPATSYFGAPLDFEARVSSTSSGVPTGSVDFTAEGTDLGSADLGSNGRTTGGPLAVLDVGASVTATYGGDPAFTTSGATLEPKIMPAKTAIVLSSSANPATPGSNVTLTATVVNTSTSIVPFGSVQFSVNGSPILTPQALDEAGQAAIIGQLPAGAYDIGAAYQDDTAAIPDFDASQAVLAQSFSIPTYMSTQPFVWPTAKPKALFALGAPAISRSGTIRLAAQSTRAGTFRFTAYVIHGHGAATYGRGEISSSGLRSSTLTISPTAKARKALARYKHLRLKLIVGFTTADGATLWSTTRRITVTSGRTVRAARAVHRS